MSRLYTLSFVCFTLVACSEKDASDLDTGAVTAPQADTDTDVDSGIVDSGSECEEAPFYPDADEDGFGAPVDPIWSCEAPDGFVSDNLDCDDTDPAIHPGAMELCGGVDEDCDGLWDDEDDNIDEATLSVWYLDADGDGFAGADAAEACDPPGEDWFADEADCDDTDDSIHPDAEEICEDGVDNNCDAVLDESCAIEVLDDAVAVLAGAGGGFGQRVAGGDITGDGVDDLLVGAYFMGSGYEGGALVFAGPITGALTAADAVGTIDGTVAEGAVGWSVATTEDVDGDGVQDVLLGGPGTGGSSSSIPGYAYLVTASPVGGLTLPDDAQATFVGAALGANAGSHAEDVGDVNNDGIVDLLIGAQQAWDLGGTTGQAYLFSGDVAGTLDVDSDATTTLYGAVWAGGMGDWASSGDLTGDGISDIVLPANTSHVTGIVNGAVFIVSEPPAGLVTVDSDIDTYVSGDDWTGLGHATAVGDWTGDGYDDLAVSTGTSPGTVYIMAGPLAGAITVTDAVASFEGLGAYLLDQTGWAIDRADLNHDGADDLAIGSPHIDITTAGPGALDVFYGPLSGAHSLSDADVAVAGVAPDALGGAVVSVGDTTGDGREELAVTSLYRDSGAGSVWLFE